MKIFTYLATLFICSSVICQDYKSKFIDANEHYSAQEYLLAIEKYEDILINAEHQDVYYNLGNA